jgi:hypothetical protein
MTLDKALNSSLLSSHLTASPAEMFVCAAAQFGVAASPT